MDNKSKLDKIEAELREVLKKIRAIPEEDLVSDKSLFRLLSTSGATNNILKSAHKESQTQNAKTLKEILKIIKDPMCDMEFYNDSYKNDYYNTHFTKNIDNSSKIITISISYDNRFQIHLYQTLNLDRDDIENLLLYSSVKILNIDNSANPEENAKIVSKQIKSMLIEFNQKNLEQILEIQQLINEMK